MEHLLTLSFDNLSSRSHSKIRKGLRQIEGLLAQICLSSSSTNSSPSKSQRQPSASTTYETPLDLLRADPAFLEFFRLQQSFEYNLGSKLLSTLSLLLATQPTTETSDLTTATLQTLHGILLLHPPSRALFAPQGNITLLLDLLSPATYPPAVITATLLVLLTALLDHPTNTRTFESTDGLARVTAILQSSDAQVHRQTEDFLAFYLMAETPDPRVLAAESRALSSDSVVAGGVALPSTPSSRLPSTDISTPSTQQHRRLPSRLGSFTNEPSQISSSPISFSRDRVREGKSSGQLHFHQRNPSKLSEHASGRSDGSGRSWGSLGQGSGRVTRSSEEKRAMLGVFVRSVRDGGEEQAKDDGFEMRGVRGLEKMGELGVT